jgi:hypothetical protein
MGKSPSLVAETRMSLQEIIECIHVLWRSSTALHLHEQTTRCALRLVVVFLGGRPRLVCANVGKKGNRLVIEHPLRILPQK